jgi:hypothetical protein
VRPRSEVGKTSRSAIEETRGDAGFRHLLLESIDESLRNVFSERVRQTIFYQLEDQFSLRREEVPQRVRDFEKGLTAMVGSPAAAVLIRVIVRNVCAKLEIPYQRVDYGFKMYVEDCKRRYEEKRD